MSTPGLQCPFCGASLTPEGRRPLRCSSCGALLRVGPRPSGSSTGAPDDVKRDAGPAAQRAALAQLEEQLEDEMAERAELRQRWEDLDRRPKPVWRRLSPGERLALGLIFVLIILPITSRHGSTATCEAAFLLLWAAFFVADFIHERLQLGDSPADESYALLARIREAEGRIAEMRRKMEAIRAEIDGPAGAGPGTEPRRREGEKGG